MRWPRTVFKTGEIPANPDSHTKMPSVTRCLGPTHSAPYVRGGYIRPIKVAAKRDFLPLREALLKPETILLRAGQKAMCRSCLVPAELFQLPTWASGALGGPGAPLPDQPGSA